MSVRTLTFRLIKSVWRGVNQAETGVVKEKIQKVTKTLEIEGPSAPKQNGSSRWQSGEARARTRSVTGPAASLPSSNAKGFTFASARRVLVDNVLKRVTNSQAAILRRRAANQLTICGNSAPFLALVGVSLASGSGIITKEDEIESICYEIRQTVGKTRLLHSSVQSQEDKQAKDSEEKHMWSLADFQLGKSIEKGCSAVVYSARIALTEESEDANNQSEKQSKDSFLDDRHEFPLAIKMMFNYHAESNAFTILRAMQRETVPSRSTSMPDEMEFLYHSLDANKATVRPHPNIVDMVTVFADQVPGLPGAMQLYGDALPARLNPTGCGRNMSLFLVMKRYDCSLRQYLKDFGQQLTPRTSLVLFTQLLEGIAFLVESGVAHRDLKSDNLLLDLSGGPEFPNLVITDFGCCLSDTYHGLRLPYRTFDTDKGGNAALMAPEVAMAQPGAFTNINYSKSDLWTAGTIAYELFGLENPFYRTDNGRVKIDTRNYKVKELPSLPEATPPLVSILVASLLARDPAKRPTPRIAATICQLILWAPSSWCRGGNLRPPDTQEILQWLLTMTTKVVYESRWGNTKAALFEYTLVATFLATMSIRSVREALRWIRDQECIQ